METKNIGTSKANNITHYLAHYGIPTVCYTLLSDNTDCRNIRQWKDIFDRNYGCGVFAGRVQVTVKVSGLTWRSGLVKGENALVSGELTEAANGEHEMEVLLV